MKKLNFLILMLTLVALLLSACSSTSNAKLTTLYNATADLTHDGEKERIVRVIDGAEDGEAAVKIYTKKDDKNLLIWMDKLGTEKEDQKGIYLCKKSGVYDIMIWKPTYEDDTTTLEYSVFYLDYNTITDKATPVEELHESITFTDEQVTKDGDKYAEASNFVYTLNKYLSKSAAMIDTVGGELIYSPSNEDLKKNLYYPKWYDKNFKPEETESSKPSNTLPPDSSRITESEEELTDQEKLELEDSKYDEMPEYYEY